MGTPLAQKLCHHLTGKKNNIDLAPSYWQAELLGSVRIRVTLLSALPGRWSHSLKCVCGQARVSLYIYFWLACLLTGVSESLIPSWDLCRLQRQQSHHSLLSLTKQLTNQAPPESFCSEVVLTLSSDVVAAKCAGISSLQLV